MQGPQGVLENGARNGGSVLGSRLYSCPQRMARKCSQCNALLLTPLLIGLVPPKVLLTVFFFGIFFVEKHNAIFRTFRSDRTFFALISAPF